MRRLILPTIFVLGCILMSGCGPKEVDPNAPVDAPGYYNGPMEPRGAGQGAGGADAKTAPEGASGS